MTTTTSPGPELIGAAPPPLRRDRMVQAWLAAVTVSWVGDAAWTVALAWTAVHTLSPTLAGVVIGAEMLPQAALVLVGGVLADRRDPRRILVAGQVARALTLLAGALAWSSGLTGAPTLLAVAVVFGVTAGLTIPSGAALVRQLVAGEDLGTVSGWSQIGNRVARLLGAPAGGLLVAWGGPVAAMLADAATFVMIAAVMVLVVRPRFRLPRAAHARWRETFSDGVGYLRRTPAARLFVVGLTALNVFVTPVTALGLALRVSDSGWGPHWLGLADAALAAGAILGSLLGIRRQPVHAARAGFRLLVLQGLGLAAVGLPWVVGAVGGMALVGLTAGAASVWLSGAFLRTVDPGQVGRVSSVTSLGDMTLMPLSVPVLGALAASSGVLTATAVFGLAMAVLCLWFATRPVLARLT